MPKKKEKNSVEYYKGLIRSYKKTISRLEKQLESLTYRSNELEKPVKEKKENSSLCRECGKGELKLLDLGQKKFLVCQLCKSMIKVE